MDFSCSKVNVTSQSFFMLSQSSSYDSEVTLFECHSTIRHPQLLAAMPYTTSPFPLRCRVPTYPQQVSEDSAFQCTNVRRWLSSGAFSSTHPLYDGSDPVVADRHTLHSQCPRYVVYREAVQPEFHHSQTETAVAS